MAGGGERDVHSGDPGGHQERCTGVLEGVEAAQQQRLGGERDQAQPEGLEHLPQRHGGFGTGGAVRVQQLRHLRAEGHEEDGRRDDDRATDPQRAGEVVPQVVQAPFGDRPGHPRQQRGDQRDGDDGLRQAPDVLRVRVRGEADTGLGQFLVGGRRVVRDDGHRDQVDQHEKQRPAGRVGALAQPGAAPVEARPEAEARLARVGDQREGLEGDADRGADAEQPHLRVGDLRHRLRNGQQAHVRAEHGDQDDVVEHRRPHHRAELPARVEHLPQDAVHPVEEDLRQQEPGEDDGQFVGGVVVRRVRRVQADDLGRGPHREQRADAEDGQDERDQPLLVRPPAVRVLHPGPYELRHEHGVERAADQQRVQAHRDEVGGVVRGGQQARTEGGGLEDAPEQAGSAGDDRARGHQEGGAAQTAGGGPGPGVRLLLANGP